MKFKRYIKEAIQEETPKDLVLEPEAEVVEEAVATVSDMEHRCEKCDTLLNDMGSCPKCDEGEEDYGDMDESLSVREKLQRAYPELDFDKHDIVTEDCVKEELSAKEKLEAAFPGEFNFNEVPEDIKEEPEATSVEDGLSNKEKLEKAFPGEFNFNKSVEKTVTEEVEFDYDDEYEFEDDVEMDRRHAALYGGDRMYCDCGAKLNMNEWGSYCPVCDAEEQEMERIDAASRYDDEV